MADLPRAIRITEVGPRDGLQNEKTIIPVEEKARFVDALSQTGVAKIEVSSFVSPRWIPQLADAQELFARISRRDGVIYSALVPNERGLERALAAKVGKIAVFTAASETFSEHNLNATIAQTIARLGSVVRRAKDENLPVRGYISCIVQCPYEGLIDPAAVAGVAKQLFDLGIDELDLGETLGVASPVEIERVYEALADLIEPAATTLHLHDTYGMALACALRAMQLGVRSFDASCGGIGGCPYAPGAAGNVATEDLVYLCERMGIETSVDLDRLLAVGAEIAKVLGRTPGSRLARAMRSAER